MWWYDHSFISVGLAFFGGISGHGQNLLRKRLRYQQELQDVHEMMRRYFLIGHAVFTALHVMQTRYSDENSVCPSVRPSVCHTGGL